MYVFHQASLLFKYFTKVNKFGILGKLLPSGALLYTFSLKRKKWYCKKWQWVFSTSFLVKLKFFLTTNIKFLFRCGNYFKSFQCKIRYSWHFHYIKQNNGFLAKNSEVLMCCFILNFMKDLLLRNLFSVTLNSA